MNANQSFPGPGLDRHCVRCGGLIPVPGRVYGYVGKFCTCDQAHVEQNKPLQDALKRIVDAAPVPKPATPTPPAMSADHFVIWLRGFLAGISDESTEVKAIAAKLDTVGGPK